MEPVGRHAGGVASIAASRVTRTCFLSAGEDDHALKLWDVRLKKKDFMTLGNLRDLRDITEIVFDHGVYHAVAACAGGQLVCVDIRQPSEAVAVVALPTEAEDVSCLMDGWGAMVRPSVVQDAQPTAGWDAVAADDNGYVYPVDMRALFRTTLAEPTAVRQQQRFGGTGNICCGLGATTAVAGTDGCEAMTCLWSVSMGGVLQGFLGWPPSAAACNDAATAARQSSMRLVHASSIGDLRTAASMGQKSTKVQLHNPPIPTCLTAAGAHVVIGRGDGTYTVLQASNTTHNSPDGNAVGLEEVLSAPAHQENGLVYVQWLPSSDDGGCAPSRLLTIALSGEITGWDLNTFMGDAVPEEDDDGSLPPVVFAESLRQDGTSGAGAPHHRGVVVNCGDLLWCGGAEAPVCLVGDSRGNVYYSPVA